ncbi:MAG: acetyl-CoA carboxylase biotin carboxylase subunit [Blastocatellia bacterium]|nr:acetyl-CoA carboxylase biotin carboxylase subunit [Blastocatellia bacterium]
MFKKVLIANRGEIAVRLIRACRDLGISPVAVYSDVDANALHVRMADEAVHIGPSPALQSYLSVEKIIAAAQQTGSEAIHPGYGFLSENAAFAAAVEAAGLVFIGPPAPAIEAMGNKISAREIAIKAGAPVVPGVQDPVETVAAAQDVARQIGYPIMLKAASGGGGKGMRIIRSEAELPSSFELARSEAMSAFKDATVYLERYIERPRHIEIQIMGDKFGHVVYLGERECSVQRRNQKVIEECPSPINDPDLRRRMGEAAVHVAKLVGYHSAGTVEFLVDADRNFYFLEMNTRLQVEHPVTELVTGLDLAVLQIRMAAGEKLTLQQEDIVLRGWAIECRIYAEDPARDFMPAPGKITTWRLPEGPGVRVDSGVFEGWDVPIDYDPLLAKLVCWGSDREQAIARLERALREFAVSGARNNLEFFQNLVADSEFQAGFLDTGFIRRYFDRQATQPAVSPADPPLEPAELAVLLAGFLHQQETASGTVERNVNGTQSAWKHFGWKRAQASKL